MADLSVRELERAAATGDEEAAAKLARARWRTPTERTAETLAADVVHALGAAWEAIRARAHQSIVTRTPLLPAAVIIVASAGEGRRRAWGHWGESRWTYGGAGGEAARAGEVMIAGELLAPRVADFPDLTPAERVLGTLLHEAAHTIAWALNVKDTSRGGRYHNTRYRDFARQLGLEVQQDKTHGWCVTRPTKETLDAYRPTIEAIARALRGYRAAEPETEAREPGTGWLRASCGCRAIRVARSVLEAGPITCGVCGGSFTLPEGA